MPNRLVPPSDVTVNFKPSNKVVSIDTGGHRAKVLERRDELVLANMALVEQIAAQVARTLPGDGKQAGFDLEDLKSTGAVALLDAATRYSPERHGGTPFAAFARPMVHGRIVDSVRRRNYLAGTSLGLDEASYEAPAKVVEIDIDRKRMADRLQLAIDELPERMKLVINLHYQDGEKLADIGGKVANLRRTGRVGIKRSMIGKIHRQAIEALRASLGEVAI